MAYNKDAHRADITQQTINDLRQSIDDLKNELKASNDKIRELLNGNGAPLENIPATNLTGEFPLELIPVRDLSGIGVVNGELCIDPTQVKRLTEKGQTISQDDTILLYDTSRGEMRQSNLAELYKQFIHLNVPHAAGQGGHIQFKGGADFSSTSNLRYDNTRQTLVIDTLTEAQNLKVRGAFQTSIAKIDHDYTVESADYTLIVDTTAHNVNITLPRPSQHEGRILTIKKTSNLNQIVINTVAGKIDNTEKIILEDVNSYVSVQSDSHDWWIINKVDDTADWWIVKKTDPQ